MQTKEQYKNCGATNLHRGTLQIIRNLSALRLVQYLTVASA